MSRRKRIALVVLVVVAVLIAWALVAWWCNQWPLMIGAVVGVGIVAIWQISGREPRVVSAEPADEYKG